MQLNPQNSKTAQESGNNETNQLIIQATSTWTANEWRYFEVCVYPGETIKTKNIKYNTQQQAPGMQTNGATFEWCHFVVQGI